MYKSIPTLGTITGHKARKLLERRAERKIQRKIEKNKPPAPRVVVFEDKNKTVQRANNVYFITYNDSSNQNSTSENDKEQQANVNTTSSAVNEHCSKTIVQEPNQNNVTDNSNSTPVSTQTLQTVTSQDQQPTTSTTSSVVDSASQGASENTPTKNIRKRERRRRSSVVYKKDKDSQNNLPIVTKESTPTVTERTLQTIKPQKKMEPKIKLNMLQGSNQDGKPLAKPYWPAGIPRSFLRDPNYSYGTVSDVSGQPSASTPSQVFDIAPNPQPQVDDHKQRYSPTDTYETREGSESPDLVKSIQKRQSAFDRLGPRDERKKPKLTINLLTIRNQSVREVVDEDLKEDRFLPVHLRKELIESKDEIVTKFLPQWPWKKSISIKSRRTSKTSGFDPSVMEEYDKTHMFFEISIKGYPAKWRKEDVLDALLDNIKAKSLIPCFIEFNPKECKMLVIRCSPALLAIHKLGFFIRKNTVELPVTIASPSLSLSHLDFIPRLIIRKLLALRYDDERKLNLSAFTMQPDISHFIYFPLNREQNQIELFQMLNVVAWDYLTDLDLSHNRLTTLEGFDLPNATPKLKHLDLSFNCFEKITPLIPLRTLSLNSIKLEGNPLCHNYTDPAHYVQVLRMISPSLKKIDDLPIRLKGEFPPSRRNYCPESATALAEKFLETFFPLLEGSLEDKVGIVDMYDKKAVMTITIRQELRQSPIFLIFRNLFTRSRHSDMEWSPVEGSTAIASIINKWPALQHDPHTFNVDVIHHTDTSTILRVSGVLKITAVTLADDEYTLSFTRTVVLESKNGVHYKIHNEMLYWDVPNKECLDKAFRINTVKSLPLSLKIESLDKETKENLMAIFMTITDLDKKASERCLEVKEWNLKLALEHFMKLLKLDDLQSLNF